MTPTRATAALYYVPEAYSMTGPKLMGRNASGASFLRGFARHADTENFWCLIEDQRHAESFARELEAARPGARHRAVLRHGMGALSEVGTLHAPGPGLTEFAWQRRLFGPASWSLTGITHTTASARAMDSIVDWLTAPLEPWDAVICTSTAVHDNVERLLEAQQQYLTERLGAARFVRPQLPVIPLGINTDEFVFTDDDKARSRAAIGADHDTLVVLFAGRLSFHAKAHPLAMYQALEEAARSTRRRIVLIECGWHANDHIERAFATAAAVVCPSVTVRRLDGRDARQRKTAWASADVFCSLSDNIQETFGLVPIEAMAAGLPCVVSDWNGYRDTVRDGVDGFRIPTLAPSPGAAADMAAAHALESETYDMYCGQTCMLVAVDVRATADAFRTLFANDDLRHRMGASGRERAGTEYDWKSIVPRYEALWRELRDRRVAAAKAPKPATSPPWPARLEPFTAFSGYPTHRLSGTTRLGLGAADASQALEKLERFNKLDMVKFARRTDVPTDQASHILAVASQGPTTADRLVQSLPPELRPAALRALVRLVKLDVLRLADV